MICNRPKADEAVDGRSKDGGLPKRRRRPDSTKRQSSTNSANRWSTSHRTKIDVLIHRIIAPHILYLQSLKASNIQALLAKRPTLEPVSFPCMVGCFVSWLFCSPFLSHGHLANSSPTLSCSSASFGAHVHTCLFAKMRHS